MNTLDELTKLLADLEIHVTELGRKDSQLAIEVGSKESRRTFLIKAIKELEEKQTGLLDKQAATAKSAKDAQTEADRKLTDTKNEILRAEQQREQRIKILDDRLSGLKAELVKIDKQIADERQIIDDLKQVKSDLLSEVERLNKLVATKKAEIQQEIIEAQAKADREIIRIDEEVEQANQELIEINRHIASKTDEHNNLVEENKKIADKVKAGQQRLDDFKEHEKRAKKALSARESALDEGEAQLATKRRRSSVLDNAA